MDGIDLVTMRLRAGLKQQEVAEAMGRSSAWLCKRERVAELLRPEAVDSIMKTIKRLSKENDSAI